MINSNEKSFKIWLWITVIPVFVAITLRVFFIAIYQVPSSSMEPALLSGDIILVSKSTYGPRLLKCYMYLKHREVEYFRLKGRSLIKKGDIVVFNMPSYNFSTDSAINRMADCIAKRIYGKPGDTVLIENYKGSNDGVTRFQAESQLFPHDSTLNWTLEKYGPLYVPAQGDSIHLTEKNACWYKEVMLHENPEGQIKDNTLVLNGETLTAYVFKENYYFVLGDNFYNSFDSRYWGFVSEDNIVGEVIMTLFSINHNETGLRKFRFKRMFKKV